MWVPPARLGVIHAFGSKGFESGVPWAVGVRKAGGAGGRGGVGIAGGVFGVPPEAFIF